MVMYIIIKPHENYKSSHSLQFFLPVPPTQMFHQNLKVLTMGIWVAQSVKRPTSAQVMISRSVSSSPTSDSVLTAQSLDPALDSVTPSLSAPSPFTLCLKNTMK